MTSSSVSSRPKTRTSAGALPRAGREAVLRRLRQGLAVRVGDGEHPAPVGDVREAERQQEGPAEATEGRDDRADRARPTDDGRPGQAAPRVGLALDPGRYPAGVPTVAAAGVPAAARSCRADRRRSARPRPAAVRGCRPVRCWRRRGPAVRGRRASRRDRACADCTGRRSSWGRGRRAPLRARPAGPRRRPPGGPTCRRPPRRRTSTRGRRPCRPPGARAGSGTAPARC